MPRKAIREKKIVKVSTFSLLLQRLDVNCLIRICLLDWDLSGFLDLILNQTKVATVVKVADDEDEALFALVTALNLASHTIVSDLELLLEKKEKDVGLLDEVSWATEDEFEVSVYSLQKSFEGHSASTHQDLQVEASQSERTLLY
ncbi:PREDICTED: protein BCCIP homolog isoform X2 [Camelina sativa]|uniref:Protein BCCIP homolog isoform X2 n=1 Tax=Camelina sativa TaxID=90675 RepID=A0ABM1RMF2_CAMSA|nr:PREDICTED: protein BCCIP homolog isoform X2 [Camelina sativa]